MKQFPGPDAGFTVVRTPAEARAADGPVWLRGREADGGGFTSLVLIRAVAGKPFVVEGLSPRAEAAAVAVGAMGVTGDVDAVSVHLDRIRPDRLTADPFGVGSPVVQGPMANVAEKIDLARAVLAAGGLPFCALGALRPDAAEAVLRSMQELPGAWGAGLIGFEMMPHRDAHLELLHTYRPAHVILAGGSIALALELQASGLRPWLHTPTPRLALQALRRGVSTVVLEGHEAGGHVGALTSIQLWSETFEQLDDLEGTVVLAGGIGDPMSAAFAAALAGDRRVQIALQAGTAFFFTEEIVASGQITPLYQRAAVDAADTVLVGGSANLPLRCAPNAYTTETLQIEERWLSEGLPLPDRRRRIEHRNLGRCRIAAKGIVRVGPGQYATLPQARQLEEGAFTMGQGATVSRDVVTVATLVDQLTKQAARLLPAPSLYGPVIGVSGEPSALSTPAAAPVSLRKSGRGAAPIAIVGLGCVVPGAHNPETFWSNLVHGVDAVGEVPEERWSLERYWEARFSAKDKTTSRFAGAVRDFHFDPLPFRIPPRVVPTMDRAQCFALVAAAQAVAGLKSDPERSAVILGNSMGGEWAKDLAVRVRYPEVLAALGDAIGPEAEAAVRKHLDATLPPIDVESMAGLLSNVIAGRVASWLDWMGGNLTVDAACAASLAAVSVAVDWLRNGRCDLVLTGGVDADLSPETYVGFSRTHALSETGSSPFSRHADGFVMGEGCAIFALKRLDDALRDDDPVWAVIKGVGQSSDGRGHGITAPKAAGQQLAIRRAAEDAGLESAETLRSLGFVECHGTGTAVGDRTEVGALRELLADTPEPVWLGSVKSMLGHLKGAAGAAGLLKATLSLATGVVAPTLHAGPVHPEMRLRGTGICLPRHPVRLQEGRRRAGISAFGFGGTNFHLLLEAAPAQARVPDALAAMTGLAEPLLRDAETARWPLEDTPAVLVFPGQGAQRRGDVEAVRQQAAGAAVLDQIGEIPTGDDPLSLHLRIFAVGVAWAAIARERGVPVVATVGHSLGEYAALVAAGRLSIEAGLELVRARGEALSGCVGGGMLAVEASASDLVDYIAEPVVLAADNGPRSVVISGPLEDLDRLELPWRSLPLNVPCAYHSAAVDPAISGLLRALERVDFSAGERAWWSVCTASPDPEPAASLLAALREPVRFRETIEALLRAGHRRFVEVGPGRSLSRLLRQIAPDAEVESLDVSRATPKRSVLAAPPPSPTEPHEATDVRSVVLAAVSEVTGYPPSFLEQHGELESELGVDSIRKLEILGVLEERLGFSSRDADVAALATIDVDGLVRFCEERAGQGATPASLSPEILAEVHLAAFRWRRIPPGVHTLPVPEPGTWLRHEDRVVWFPQGSPRQVALQGLELAREQPAPLTVIGEGAAEGFACSLAREWDVPLRVVHGAPRPDLLAGEGVVRLMDGVPHERIAVPLLPAALPRYERVLATGGTRGIVLECLTALLPAEITLLGRSDPTPFAIERLEAAGHSVRFVRGDVLTPDIDIDPQLILHGAGATRDGLAADLGPQDVEAVFGPKLVGQAALAKRWPGARLVSFGSLVAKLGNPGQTVYGAANAALPGDVQEWTAWSEVGMAASPVIQSALARRGIRSLSPALGRRAFVAALGHEGRIAISAQRLPDLCEPPAPLGPLLDPHGRVSVPLDPNHPMLRDHRVAGRPLVPAAVWVQAIDAAARWLLDPDGGWSIVDFEILAPLFVERPRTAWLTLEGDSVSIGSGDSELVRARLLLAPPLPGAIAVEAGSQRDAGPLYRPDALFHGPHWQVLDSVSADGNGRIGARLRRGTSLPGAVDAIHQLLSVWSGEHTGYLGLPVGAQRWSLSAGCLATRLTCRVHTEGKTVVGQAQAVDEHGQVCVAATGVRLERAARWTDV